MREFSGNPATILIVVRWHLLAYLIFTKWPQVE